MQIKGIIFDLDGVLVFTDKFHYQAWKQIANNLGVYFDEKINNRLRGISRMDSLDIILENYHGIPLSDKTKLELAEEKNSKYLKLLQEMTPDDVSEKIRNTLYILRENGFKLAIGSSSKNAKLILDRVNLLNFFDAISDGNNITYSKPNPEVFEKASHFLHLQPQECIVVEDAEAGIDAALAGKMHPIAIGNAVFCHKAEYNIQKLSDLLTLLKIK